MLRRSGGAADLADNYPTQYLSPSKQDRLNELHIQLGNHIYFNRLQDLSSGVEITFKAEDFDPIENAIQSGPFWTQLKIRVDETKIYGVTPLPPDFIDPYDYVITLDGELRIGLGHFNLSEDANEVLGAGRLKINTDGKIWWVDGESGHYKPTQEELDATAQILRDNNMASANMIVKPVIPED